MVRGILLGVFVLCAATVAGAAPVTVHFTGAIIELPEPTPLLGSVVVGSPIEGAYTVDIEQAAGISGSSSGGLFHGLSEPGSLSYSVGEISLSSAINAIEITNDTTLLELQGADLWSTAVATSLLPTGSLFTTLAYVDFSGMWLQEEDEASLFIPGPEDGWEVAGFSIREIRSQSIVEVARAIIVVPEPDGCLLLLSSLILAAVRWGPAAECVRDVGGMTGLLGGGAPTPMMQAPSWGNGVARRVLGRSGSTGVVSPAKLEPASELASRGGNGGRDEASAFQ